MLSLIKTLLNGAGASAEEAFKDRFAVDLLGQHIRDAESAHAAAKQTLASLIIRQRTEHGYLDQLNGRIADLEMRTRSALADGVEGLAQAAAGAIAELENERMIRRATVQSLYEKAARMRLSIEKAHRRIVALKQGMISARAIDAERKAQGRLVRSIGGSARIRGAEARLQRITEGAVPFAESEVLDEIDGELSHDAIRDRLADAGHGPVTRMRAEDVLARLRGTAAAA